MLLRHALALPAASGDIRLAVDDNVLLVCDIAAGSAAAFDVCEQPQPGEQQLQPLAMHLVFATPDSQVSLDICDHGGVFSRQQAGSCGCVRGCDDCCSRQMLTDDSHFPAWDTNIKQ